jgi:hypothetical protein
MRLFSSGVPGDRELERGVQAPGDQVGAALVVLDELGLVEQQARPGQPLVGRRVEPEQRVGGDDQVRAGDLLGDGHGRGPLGLRDGHHPQTRGEPLGLVDPVGHHEVGATTRNGASTAGPSGGSTACSTIASAWTVFPRPMSSARMPPRPCRRRNVSHR